MDDLTKHWSSLSLSEREGQGFQLNREQAINEHGIVARFLTKRPLNIDAIANTFTPLWRSKSGFKIKSIGDHLILFSFENPMDVDHILLSEPWSFDKHIMVLSRYNIEAPISEHELTLVPFWVQLHDIPLRFRNRVIAEQICEPVGLRLNPNENEDWDGGSFIRVRLQIDISKPLCRGRFITLEDGKEHWVPFKYERLPNLCYWCGCLTHVDKDCAAWFESEGSLKTENQQFGAWLRASPFMAARKKVVSVPGFFARKKVACSSHTASATPNRQLEAHVPGSDPKSPKGADETAKSQACRDANVTFGASQKITEENKIPPSTTDAGPEEFEQLIQNLDREINYFDKGPDSLDLPSKTTQSFEKDIAPQMGHTLGLGFESPISQALKATPLSDQSNMDHDPVISKGQLEGKWMRIQRPTILKDCNYLDFSPGKRSGSSLFLPDSPKPSKRRAFNGANNDENVLPTAEAAVQPRRDR